MQLHNIEFRHLRVVEKDGSSHLIQQYRKMYLTNDPWEGYEQWTKWTDVPTVTLEENEKTDEQTR